MAATFGDDISIDELISGLGRFVDNAVLPLEEEHKDLLNDERGAKYDAAGGYSPPVVSLIHQVRTEAANAGYFTMFCPQEIGGGGLGATMQFLAYEYLHSRYGPAWMLPYETIAHWAFGPSFLCSHFTPTVTAKVLDEVMSGRAGMCFGMSEPDAGSDAWMMKTHAYRDGDEWVINGTKQWTTNSPHASYCYLFAVTDRALVRERRGGISCFLVPMATPGVVVDSVIKTLGDVGGDEGIVSFTDVRIPADHLVGEEGSGFKLAIRGVSLGRVYNSARAMGFSQWALRRAIDYAKDRVTFGKPIAQHQGVNFKLADSAMEIYAARHAALDLTARLDRGQAAIRELAMTKAFCCETMLRVADRTMQVCGAMGLTNEMNLYKVWHLARRLQIADGSAEILRTTISGRLLKGELDF